MLNFGNGQPLNWIEKVMAQHREWLGLMIGNSRLHWGYFQDSLLCQTWETPHFELDYDRLEAEPTKLSDPVRKLMPVNIPPVSVHCPLYLASVVPSQTIFWKTYPQARILTLEQIPLHHLYPTLGIDRALAVLGAGEKYGFPIMVIDGGTALTLTGVDNSRSFVGGAIMPGLRLQFQSLSQKTAQLPNISLPETLPPRWANSTQEAIASGVLYSILDSLDNFIGDWKRQFPDSQIIFTGGDGVQLLSYWQQQDSSREIKPFFDPDLIFEGMRSLLS